MPVSFARPAYGRRSEIETGHGFILRFYRQNNNNPDESAGTRLGVGIGRHSCVLMLTLTPLLPY